MYQALKDNFIISTDAAKINIETVHHYLCNESYWAKNISLQIVARSIENSFCFGLYKKNDGSLLQVGFARAITDKATFGYLANVFILPKYQGMGLGKWLITEIMNHPELQGFRRWMLATKDAHGLYEPFGFKVMENTGRLMGFKQIEEY